MIKTKNRVPGPGPGPFSSIVRARSEYRPKAGSLVVWRRVTSTNSGPAPNHSTPKVGPIFAPSPINRDGCAMHTKTSRNKTDCSATPDFLLLRMERFSRRKEEVGDKLSTPKNKKKNKQTYRHAQPASRKNLSSIPYFPPFNRSRTVRELEINRTHGCHRYAQGVIQ